MSIREVVESRLTQGADESIPYALTTTNWGSSPTNVAVVAKNVTAGNTDVTATVLSGAASVSGDVITLPTLISLTAGNLYRIEVKFTISSTIFEAFLLVQAEV